MDDPLGRQVGFGHRRPVGFVAHPGVLATVQLERGITRGHGDAGDRVQRNGVSSHTRDKVYPEPA